MLSRHSGDLYRIASIIVDDTFTDEFTVNPLRSNVDANMTDIL